MTLAAPGAPADARAAAEGFEALVLARMLAAARAARLADSPLVPDGEWLALADQQLARLLARGSPLGLGRLVTAAVEGAGGDLP